ncbi:MAG: four helix bundle protein [Bacteroidetes bacterium HGW-Bacteroidetes-6]|nr:MAG: four helix bundle protein [Bacteroidetes bacterium HGW-Bacteroidetes-6]
MKLLKNFTMEQGFNDKYRDRTKRLAVGVIKLLRKENKSDEYRILHKQLVRSITSVGANFRASCRSRSEKDYLNKLAITIEELDESQYWIELLIELGELTLSDVKEMMDEISSVLAVLTKLHYNKKGGL